MRNQRFTNLVRTLWAALVLTACAQSDVEQAFCESYCHRLDQCNLTDAENACTNRCLDGGGTALQRTRSEVADPMKRCISNLACYEISPDTAADCLTKAINSLAPSDATMEFCDIYTTRVFECEGAVYRLPDCQDDYKSWNDDTLDDFTQCLEQDCDQIVSCFDDLLR